MKKAKYYIQHEKGMIYDTNDDKFYSENFTIELDTKAYLKALMKNNPEKFENCKIVKHV